MVSYLAIKLISKKLEVFYILKHIEEDVDMGFRTSSRTNIILVNCVDSFVFSKT